MRLDDETEKHHDLLNKNDWEIIIVFLARLRRCLLLLGKCRPTLPVDGKYLKEFDRLIPVLVNLRDFEEHFDDYSSGKSKRAEFEWGYLETYYFGEKVFENGVGKVTAETAQKAALEVWTAVISVEDNARKHGFLTWDDRYSRNEQMGDTQ